MPISKEFAGSVSFVHTHQELHASMQRYLPELEIVHEFNKGSDTTRVLVPTGENLILVTKDNISTSFEFNPTQSETLGVYLPHDQKYPPEWSRHIIYFTLFI